MTSCTDAIRRISTSSYRHIALVTLIVMSLPVAGCGDDAPAPVVKLMPDLVRPSLGTLDGGAEPADVDAALPEVSDPASPSAPETPDAPPPAPDAPPPPPADMPPPSVPEAEPDPTPAPAPGPEDEEMPAPAPGLGEDGEEADEPEPEDENERQDDAVPEDENMPAESPDEPPAGTPEVGPFDAPARDWAWMPIEGTKCADGSPTGLGVNLSPESDTLVIYTPSGGACWDGLTCYVLNFASNIDGYGAGKLENGLLSPQGIYAPIFFERDDPENPLADANYVFLPYCTGDLLSGRQVVELEDLFGNPRETHFVGHLNMQRYVERLAEAFPNVDRVWLIGTSGGGFGMLFNWPLVRAAFPDARFDVMTDASAAVPAGEEQWEACSEAWQPFTAPDCEACATGFPELQRYLLDTLEAPSRFAAVTHDEDGIISGFLGYAPGTIGDAILEFAEGIEGADRAEVLVVPGTAHGSLSADSSQTENRDGTSVRDWVWQFLNEDPEWSSRTRP